MQSDKLPKKVGSTATAVLEPPAPVATDQKGDFVSPTPFVDANPDCLVICCSDHRYEQQSRDLARHLGFKHPHVVQFPAGATMTLPLVSAFGFMSKAADKIVEGVVDMKHLETVICVGHSECGAYKAAKHPLIGTALKFAGKTVVELQHSHLAQSAKRMRQVLRDVKVRAFFADVVSEGGTKKVKFEEIPVK